MKVIFLDHDGVICLSSEWGGRYKKQEKWGGRKLSMTNKEVPLDYRFDNFNKKAVKILNEILEETDAEIVVSSDWKRWATVEEMGEYYESQGLKKKPIGFTKFLQDCEVPQNFPWSRTYDLEQSRSLEIKQYLQDHQDWIRRKRNAIMGIHVQPCSNEKPCQFCKVLEGNKTCCTKSSTRQH